MPITLKNKNYAKSALAAGIAIDATQLTVSSGTGSLFPTSGTFRAVMYSSAVSNPLSDPLREIVDMALSSGDVFNIVRAREGTTAKAWNTSDHIAHVITAGKIDEIEAEVNIKMNSEITSFAAITTIANNDVLPVTDVSEAVLKKITVQQIQEASVASSLVVSGVTVSGLTVGSVLFAGSGGAISQDNANLFWDNTNKRLGIGNASPAAQLHIGDALASGYGIVVGHATNDAVLQLGKNADNRGFMSWVNASNIISIGTRVASTNYLNTLVLKDGNVGINTASPAISDGKGLHISGKILRIQTAKTPANQRDTGNIGEICWDSGYIYVCVNTNTWKRAAISGWA